MILVNAPNDYGGFSFSKEIRVFLGGSIEMGKAENWQVKLAEYLKDVPDLILLNPRREDWDSSWIQDPTPGTQFHEQVTWELQAQEDSDIIFYNFESGTQSPITLFELGLFGNSLYDVVVCCPEDFWRYGNVKIVCDRYGVPLYNTKEEAFVELKKKIGDLTNGN